MAESARLTASNLAATLGLRPFGLSANGSAVRVEDNNNENINDETNGIDRELEESKRFFSRFAAPTAAHQNMVQYSHLGKQNLMKN